MKLKLKKSGQEATTGASPKQKKERVPVNRRFREFYEKAGKHFDDFFVKRWKNLHNVRLLILEWGLLCLVVLILSIVQIAWYSDGYQTTTFVNGGEYSEATLGKVNSMNPLYASTNSEKALARLLFANLMSPDTTGHMKGELAKQVKRVDNDSSKWRLTLRDNIFWSDGEPITTDDLIYTIELLNDKRAKTTVAVDFTSIKIEKIDDKTVEFSLPSPYNDFMDSLEFPLVPKHILGENDPALVYEANFSKEPVCSGVFVYNAMQTSSLSNNAMQAIYLRRNDKYFLGGTRLDSFTLKTYEKISDIKQAFESEDVTATAELDDNMTFVRQSVAKRESLLNAGVYAFLNNKSPNGLSEKKVRQAIQQGIDMSVVRGDEYAKRELDYPILDVQLEGLSFPELGKYDLEAAKKLISDAGYTYVDNKITKDGSVVNLRVAYLDSSELNPVAERYIEGLKALGFEVTESKFGEAEILSGQDFYSSVIQPRYYDILLYEINLGVSVDPFVYYNSHQANSHGWNLSNYSNPLADDALLSARTTDDEALRKAKYEAFLSYWVEDVPAIGIYRSDLSYYYSGNVQIYSEDVRMTDEYDRFADVRSFATQKDRVNITP